MRAPELRVAMYRLAASLFVAWLWYAAHSTSHYCGAASVQAVALGRVHPGLK